MPAPRLEIDLAKISDNARTLVDGLREVGISVTGVTKATLGCAEIATAFIEAGVKKLGDSRIENIEAMRVAGIPAAMTLIRTPMLSQAQRVVTQADISCNTEIEVIRKLSLEAQSAGLNHGVILMVELGDLREGILPDDLTDIVRETLNLPNIAFRGIGTNLACRSGVSPDTTNMTALSELAIDLEATFGLKVEIVSGGNSANLHWALSGAETGRVNDLRLGEAILLGRETLHRQPIDGLHTDAITLCGEVIEAKIKPSKPSGQIAQTAFGAAGSTRDRGLVMQAIVAVGRQDIDPSGLLPPTGISIMGASSDHLILEAAAYQLPVGAEIVFHVNYSALLRAMTSPFVSKVMQNKRSSRTSGKAALINTHASRSRTMRATAVDSSQ